MYRRMRRPLSRFVLAFVTLVAIFVTAAAAALARVAPPAGPKNHVPRSRKLAREVVAFARRQIGVFYSYGGASRATGFDCSGLVYAAYRSIGRTIPRSSWDQRRVGRRVSFRRLLPGDLLFTEGGGHVVLVASRTSAISAPQTGERVKYVALTRLRDEFSGARRLLK
jgi:cell wall-associated NlpC family hydrolase